MDSYNRKEGCQSTGCSCNGIMNQTKNGLAGQVPGQAGNPLREPAATGQGNYNQYHQYRPMVRGYGHSYYNTYQTNYGQYRYRPMVRGNDYGYYNTYEESMQARYPYLHNTQHRYPPPQVSYPYYEQPPMYFPQAPPPPRNAKTGEPDLCSIM